MGDFRDCYDTQGKFVLLLFSQRAKHLWSLFPVVKLGKMHYHIRSGTWSVSVLQR